MAEPEVDADLSWKDSIRLQPDEANQTLPACPKCSAKFDGWKCKDCGYALPEKHRKMHPKVILPDEAAEYLKELDRELDDD